MPRKLVYTRRRKVILILCVVVLAYLLTCFVAALKFLAPGRQRPQIPVGVDAIDVPTAAGNDPTWASSNFRSANIVYLCAYGYRDSRAAWTPLFDKIPLRHDDGLTYAVVAPAMPGQDASPARWVGFGKREARVIVDAGEYIHRINPSAKIVLVGVSLDGAAVWLASAIRPYLFSAVISEAAFPSLSQGIRNYLGPVLYYGLHPMVWMAAGIWLTCILNALCFFH